MDEDDPEVAVRELLAEAVAGVRTTLAEVVRQCRTLSELEALDRMQGGLSRLLAISAAQNSSDASETRLARLILERAFDIVRKSLSN